MKAPNMYIEACGIIGATAAWVAGMASDMPFLQYGALGILAFVVLWIVTKTIPSFLVEIRNQRRDAVDALAGISASHAATMERIAETFRKEQEEQRKMCAMHFDALRDHMRDTQERAIKAMQEHAR
jgi:predicted tellurium resistance membrane protein TerC